MEESRQREIQSGLCEYHDLQDFLEVYGSNKIKCTLRRLHAAMA